jgi:hypothetical protein
MKKITVELSNGAVISGYSLDEMLLDLNAIIETFKKINDKEIYVVSITKWNGENTSTSLRLGE